MLKRIMDSGLNWRGLDRLKILKKKPQTVGIQYILHSFFLTLLHGLIYSIVALIRLI